MRTASRPPGGFADGVGGQGRAGAAPPPAGTCELWLLHVPEALPQEAAGPLDAEERRRAAAFLRPADRNRYVASHLALRHLLGGYLGLPPAEVRFFREECPRCGGPHGRPAVAGPLHFSLSHGGARALIGVAATPIGVDVEPLPAPAQVDRIAPLLHPAERAELAAAAADRRAAVFGRLWTRKESYLKGLGTGLSRGLDTDCTGTAAPPPAGWTLLDVPADPPGTQCPQHVAAAAVRSAVASSRVDWLDWPAAQWPCHAPT